MRIRFCYKISKEVGLAEDENGNKAEAYSCAALEDVKTYNLPSEQYKVAQEGMKKMIAKQLKCKLELITAITLNEYLDKTEEEGD